MQGMAKEFGPKVGVFGVDWYSMDPRKTPWNKLSEVELTRQVMRFNGGPMGILLDPEFAQINLTKYRDGSASGAVIVGRDRRIRWIGAPHEVGDVRRAIARLLEQDRAASSR